MIPSTRWSFNFSKWEPTERELLFATQCLQVEEKNRIDRFVFKEDVKASLVGRLMMRKYINENAHIPYNSIELSRDINDKPIYESKNHENQIVSFNTSHQGSYTVLAGELGKKSVGIDIMKMEYNGGKTVNEFFRLMNRNFTASEWRRIKGTSITPEKEQIARFCRNWALKESYVKAIGLGITFGLNRMNFEITSDINYNCITADTCLFIDGKKQDWFFEETLLDPSHCVAVALKKKEVNRSNCSIHDLLFRELTISHLLENAVPFSPEDHEFCKKFFLKETKRF